MRLVPLLLLLACAEGPGGEDCSNGVDDDGDGLPDCEDADCLGLRVCDEVSCEDGLDDDNDGLVDCADDDCWGLLDCRVEREVLSTRADVRVHVYGGGGACGSVAPATTFTGWASFSGYHNTTVVIDDFQTRITDRVTGEVCTWSAPQLRGLWTLTDSGMSPTAPRAEVLFGAGCTQPVSWVIPAFVRPMARLPGAAPRLVLASVDDAYNSYGFARPWLTLDLVQTHQRATRTPGSTYSLGSSECRSFWIDESTAWVGTVVPP